MVRCSLSLGVCFLVGVSLLPSLAGSLQAGDPSSWGTIKGQVVWGGEKLPERPPIKVDKNQDVCLAKGPLLSEDLVVDSRTKGVRWVMVWLIDASDPKKPKAPPIHPSLKDLKVKEIELDQPCCQFEPHNLAVREGQTVIAKNSATIPHSIKLDGGEDNPNINVIIPPGGKIEIKDWKASRSVVPMSCTIHLWMKGFIRVLDHPYYAVTDAEGRIEIKDAPAGNFNLVVWQESVGWVQGGKLGIPVTIKGNGVTDLGKIVLNPPKE